MRFNFLFLIITCFFAINIYSQGEANVWYFGYNAGLDFNSGNPVSINNSQQKTVEGCSTISDASGQLLFYTDGNFVWNRNHEIMTNGSGLLGHPSSTQSAIIIPKPNSNSLYYIFTVTLLGQTNGVRYSEVDMNLNGGLGDLTSNKNIPLLSPSTEKITAVKQNNCEDFWVVVHKYGNNSFYAYSVTSSGINLSPIISNVGTTISSNSTRTIGYLKFSPDGKKLISSNYEQNVQLFDFDNITGIISNPRIISNKYANYGVEFSPLGNIAYLTTGEFYPLELLQYDLTASNIQSTETQIYISTDTNHLFGALQLATNGKIYLSIGDLNSISVINNPDILGVGCNFGLNTVSLGSGTSKLGLPQFIQSYFSVGINIENVCLGSSSTFSYTSNQTISNITWEFGDGFTSNLDNPNHTYTSAGTYTVTATTISSSGTIIKCKQLVVSEVPIAENIPNLTICDYENMNFDLTSNNSMIIGSQSSAIFGVAYFSSLNDAINHNNILNPSIQLPLGTTIYYAKLYSLSNKNCYDIKTFSINLIQKPTANKPSDINNCEDVPYDGIDFFNLNSQNSIVLNGLSPSNYTITYHQSQSDANNNLFPLPSSYQNISQTQEIFVRLQSNSDTFCFDTTSFFIKVNKKPILNNLPNLNLCDDLSNDGVEIFDISSQINLAIGSQSLSEFVVTFHTTFSDAQLNINPIASNYSNISNPQIIYCRIENKNNSNCFEISNFQMTVKSKPTLNLNDVYPICTGNSVTINAPLGYTSYLWSNGSTSSSTTFFQEGSYSLTVYNDYDDIICENTKDFVVNNSEIATINNLEIVDLNENENSILVSVSGSGNYEYSLDGFAYQDSPQFLNVPGGFYIVYVKDKKGCGIVTEEVFVMIYPKFFTPNGDGINDVWRIKFSSQEPYIKTLIYDRYGKLIKVLKNNQDSWDGTLNGENLPATDYWFVVKLQNGKELRSHFTLKR